MTNRYSKMTWPEVNEAALQGRVAVIPAGTLEDHGLHLPIDTDVAIADRICQELADRLPDDIMVIPPITFGFSPHHLDGPGTTTLRWDTFIDSTTQIVNSLFYHGFRKVLIVNGHGSNESVLDIASRQAILGNPDSQCAMISWWTLKKVQETVKGFRESTWTGHACELETSLYMAIDPSLVKVGMLEEDINPYMTPHFWADLVSQAPEGYANPVRIAEYWSTVSRTGTWGDPRSSSAEKGRAIIDSAVNELIELIDEYKKRPIRERDPRQAPSIRARNAEMLGKTPRFTH
jgi:creatinine amidohydrolase